MKDEMITEREIIKTHRNLGFTEDVTVCDCCGKVDLKGTYAIEDLINGGISHYGCVCAANRMNWSKKEFVSHYKMEEKEQGKAAATEFRATAEYRAVEEYRKEQWAALRNNEEIPSRPELFASKDVVRRAIAAKYPLAHPIYLA